MELASQARQRVQSTALVLYQSNKKEAGSIWPSSRDLQAVSSLTIAVRAESLQRIVRGLLPFFGVKCPIAICDRRNPNTIVARGTLGSLDGWMPPDSPLLLLIGYLA